MDLFNNLNEKKYEKASSDLKIYKQKWDEISKKASSSEEASSVVSSYLGT